MKLSAKSAISIVIILITTNLVFSQDEPEYLFNLKEVKYSGFGNTITEFSGINGSFGVSQGGAGALLINYTYFIGFYGTNIVTSHPIEDIYPDNHNPLTNPLLPKYTDMQLTFEDNGVWFGYINDYKKLIHWGTNVRMGWGRVSLYDKDVDFDDFGKTLADNIFSFSPEFNLELNITRWFKINLGAGYKLVTGFDNFKYTNSLGDKKILYRSSQFSSPYANIKFMFGSFAKRSNHKQIEG